jgi:hypothetical protein
MGFDITGLGSVFDFASKVIDKIFPDKTEAEKAKLAMFQLQQQGELQKEMNEYNLQLEQIKTNAVEAASASRFVAGWRPFIGWVGGFSLAYNYIFFPLYAYTAKLIYPLAPAMPALDSGELMTLLLTMLGMGALRTWDKKTATLDPNQQTPVAPKG